MQVMSDRDTDLAVQAAFARASSLDLSPIKRKLVDANHGAGWPAQQADEAERLYRCFLALEAVYSGSSNRLVPPRAVDEFWHHHILDTRKYASDCEIMFGRFLHHFPYFGMNGPEDERALHAAAEWTRAEFAHHFGELGSDGGTPVSCSTACSSACSACRTG